MKVIRKNNLEVFKEFEGEKFIACVGVFDGVHRGHKFFLSHFKKIAILNKVKSLVVTFTNNPKIIMKKTKFCLFKEQEKIAFLKQEGIDYCLFLNFSETLKNLPAETFLEFMLKNNVIYFLVTKINFGALKKRELSTQIKKKISLIFLKPLSLFPHGVVSSTLIKLLLGQGKIKSANKLLGYQYFIEGKIVRGKQFGSKFLDCPTINLQLQPFIFLPKEGVYLTETMFWKENNQKHSSVTCVYFQEKNNCFSVETYIFNFKRNVYGKSVKVFFLDFLRDIYFFGSNFSALKATVQSDLKLARKIFKLSCK